MTSELFSEAVMQAGIVSGLVSGIPLALILVVGVICSVLQAVTQMQEQTLTFVPKLIAVSVLGLLLGGWFCQKLVALFGMAFDNVLQLGLQNGPVL